jgi:GMP synthase-like glutamine amidotransferase
MERPKNENRISMRIHYFQHVPFEGLGTIQNWIESHGHSLSITQFFHDDTLPKIDDIDWLIIMGGPMGVYDESTFPWLVKEKEFISEAIRQNKKVLGICLGAQLIASALGAKVYPNVQKEIGWFPVNLTETGKKSPLFKSFPEQIEVFHWHGDTFFLPEGARCLAESEACKHQAFSFEKHVLGLQFHLEVERNNVELLVQNCGNELHKAPFIQSAESMLNTHHYFDGIRQSMYHVLDRLEENITYRPPQ